MRALAVGLLLIEFTMLPHETLLSAGLVALTLLFLESRTGIPVLPSGPPIAVAGGDRFLEGVTGGFRRLPELSTLEPLHLRIRVALLKAAECGKKVFVIGGAKRGR